MAVNTRLMAIGKIQKEGKWMPYLLKDRDVERRVNFCSKDIKESHFCIRLLQVMINGLSMITLSA